MEAMRFKDERERLIAEQAVLAYREVQKAADDAEFGHGMEAIESVALERSREHGKRLLESALSHRARSQKDRSARTAGAKPTSNG